MNEHLTLGRPDDASSWTVPELLIRFVRATNELNRCEPRQGGIPSAQQIRSLLFLVHHDGSTIKELAHALCVSEARASRLAEELTERGLVLHERDAGDRRQVRLRVAPTAAENARRIYRERSGALEAAFVGASEEEVRIFKKLLGRVVEEFEGLAVRTATGEPVPVSGDAESDRSIVGTFS